MPFSALPSLSPDQKQKFARFQDLLLSENRNLNLTALNDPESVRVRHFDDSLAAAPVLAKMAGFELDVEKAVREGGWPTEIMSAETTPGGWKFRLIDVGSGAGLPGLALAIALPWCEVISVETIGKKARFQEKAITELGLNNVRVISDRAESIGHEVAHRERYDAATGRALAALPVLVEILFPLVRPGGSVLAWKGPLSATEVLTAQPACDELGGAEVREFPYSLEMAGETLDLRIVVLEKQGPTPARYPRKPHRIRKHPLGPGRPE
ncbi:16S rRNA (guanine(527)-N(7))-methyltransferase RsmG [bacterium]|nr:16S rRNA (guanine(527)-N(7))-methyltransferase RsmG [bacterium]